MEWKNCRWSRRTQEATSTEGSSSEDSIVEGWSASGGRAGLPYDGVVSGVRVAAQWCVGGAHSFKFYFIFFNVVSIQPYRKALQLIFFPPGAMSPNSIFFIWIQVEKCLLNPMATSVWAQDALKNHSTTELKKK